MPPTKDELLNLLSNAANNVDAVRETVLQIPPGTHISLPSSPVPPLRDPWIDYGCDLKSSHGIDPIISPEDLATALTKSAWLIRAVRKVVLALP